MPSPATCRIASPDLGEEIAAQKSAIAAIEKRLWAGGLNEALLEPYQAAFRQLEQLIAEQGNDDRHSFVIVIPVADRPQHLQSCLDSLLELCRSFAYGGLRDGRYPKVAVIIADDTRDDGNVVRNKEIVRRFDASGIATTYFGIAEQIEFMDTLPATERAELSRILGNAKPETFSHKGHAITRNIAYLWLNRQKQYGERALFYTVDSDQEFKVKVSTAQGDKDVCALNFFHYLDEIFAQTDALVLTGKVVGDPPVSPAVMAGNFLEDVIGFLREMAAGDPQHACQHHVAGAHGGGDASYHDMADLFGFKPASEAFRYRCILTGDHANADCFGHFSHRLNSFFYGEHPTRVSYYRHDEVLRTVQPARTVYVGNYIFRPEGLRYFIPFAPLRLRMSGPVLGRLLKAEIGDRFVCANLPMLHKRTVSDSGQSEFRPGINAGARAIELCDEFERQFHGDVMLFSIERLTALGMPQRELPADVVSATLASVQAQMQEKYAARRRDIVDKLGVLNSILRDPAQWWNRSAQYAAAVDNLATFAANVEHNFGADSPCYDLIDAAANWQAWQARLLAAITHYAADGRSWGEALAVARPTHPGRHEYAS